MRRPWISIHNLSIADMAEVRATARCANLLELASYVQTLPTTSRLSQHVADMKFAESPPAPASALSLPSSLPVGVPLSSTTTPPMATAKAQPRAKATAKAKAKTKAKLYSPPPAVYKLVRRASLSGSSENGHNFRVRNGIYDGHSQFDSCKYGNKPRDVARQSHDQAYDVKRVRKKPACLKKPARR